MKNQELSKIFQEISYYLEIEGIPFKPEAYERASLFLSSFGKDIEEIYEKGGVKELENLPVIGKSIALKIEEYIKTGQIKYYEDLKKKIPINFGELTRVEGLGAKTAKYLWEKLKVKNLKDLEKVAKKGKIKELPGFGSKSEKNILEAIEFLKKSKGKFLLPKILPVIEKIKKEIESLKEVEKIEVCGSVRRKKELIGDADFLVASKSPEKVMDFFVSLPNIEKVWGKGPTKTSVRVEEGFDIDLRVVDLKSFGSAVQYFTGSTEHNIAVRSIAITKGMKLSEYGLFKGNKIIAGETEEEIYNLLGLEYIVPELRENRGEIKSAKEGTLPKVVELRDIKGDLHVHSRWNGGENSILKLAEEAKKRGYEYLGISDHTKFLKIENGLDEKQLSLQRKEIDKINKKIKGIKILQGAETNIMPDGSIDINDEALSKLDYVIAGIHSVFKMNKEEMTDRIIKAMKNPYVSIISHPTGRLLKKREEYNINFEKILKVAKETNIILEINSYPERLDLNDERITRTKEFGVKMIINTDSHKLSHFDNMQFGVYQARRGWAEKKDIINTLSLNKLKKILRNSNK